MHGPRIVGLFLLLALAGCERDYFELEIRPQGERYQRRLVGWHERRGSDADKQPTRQPLRAELLSRLEALYGGRQTGDDPVKAVFEKAFAEGQTPADLGGFGQYRHFTSPLGSTTSYVERFRGDDDLQGQLEHRHAAADEAVDLLIGWFEAEAGRHPGFPQLRAFLDETLRRDVKNIGNYLWTGSAVAEGSAEDEPVQAEFFLRVGLYLLERGYLSVDDLARLTANTTSNDTGAEPLLAHLQRLAADRMGIAAGSPVPPELAFLANGEEAGASLNRYLATTDWFRTRLDEWRKTTTDATATPPQPADLYAELVSEATLEIDLFGPDADRLELTLHVPVPPSHTNGVWDAAARQVRWSADLSEHRTLPALFFARWSEPDSSFQQRHFGRTILEGEPLIDYVDWYRGMPAGLRQEWDTFVAGLRPGADLPNRVAGFRFSIDPASSADAPAPSAADLPRKLLLEGLHP